MTQKDRADQECLADRKKAFEDGRNTTHWPHEYASHCQPNSGGQNIPKAVYVPVELSEE